MVVGVGCVGVDEWVGAGGILHAVFAKMRNIPTDTAKGKPSALKTATHGGKF